MYTDYPYDNAGRKPKKVVPRYTKSDIDAMTDPALLKNIMSDVQDSEIEMVAELEYSNRPDDWRGRTIGALSHTRITIKNIKARLSELSSERNNETKKLMEKLNAHIDVLTQQNKELKNLVDVLRLENMELKK